MDNEKTNEVDKAKREIDTLLQRELEEMKIKFNATLQQKQKELEEEHQKVKIDSFTCMEHVTYTYALYVEVTNEMGHCGTYRK